MKTDEIKNADESRKLVITHFKTLKPVKEEKGIHIAEIRVLVYCELSCITSSILKLCIMALEQDELEISRTVKNPSTDVALILEIVAQLLPRQEMKFLDEVHRMIVDYTENNGN